MAEDDIPVSAAMMEAGCAEWPFSDVWHFGSYDDVCAIYRAMERMRRAEADAEVIRRSVKESGYTEALRTALPSAQRPGCLGLVFSLLITDPMAPCQRRACKRAASARSPRRRASHSAMISSLCVISHSPIAGLAG